MPLAEPVRRASLEARAIAALFRAGAFGLEPPGRALGIVRGLRDYGPVGGAPRVAALRHPDHPGVVDERGTLTWRELDEQIDRLADALRGRGIAAGTTVGILCRNHRSALLATFAASRGGLNVVWLNTAFSAPQAREVATREGVQLLFHDVEFAPLVDALELEHGAFSVDIEQPADAVTALVAEGRPVRPPAPAKPGRIVLLTSGTTGTPKGAPRPEPRSLILPGSVLERLPMRARGATVIGPPLFHGTGLLVAMLSISLGSTLILRRRFDAEQLLADIEEHRATTICVVPLMLQRVLKLGPEAIAARDLSSLSVAFSAGSRLPAEVARQATAALGDVVYNLYGSTEVSVATLATPADVRDAPDSVGRPALGVRVRILDDAGHPLPDGATGRIFVGTTTPFEGYTGGGTKEVVDGLMSTGDLGHLDAAGRLCIDGRDDEMIVSGGENVFPREVEELLLTHPAVADAAALGVEDEEFGQRLQAYVVLHDGKAVGEDELKAFVKENLARYKTPRAVLFLDELPRNPMGKILKREL